ncbi:MAG TPA: asparagine synthase (glutamine-hydrolyzing) [Acidimicrobiales bacterium]|nr:asparagine synthase (glutamine-hydrolyzing) [Acidimicrobiales bacterium]
MCGLAGLLDPALASTEDDLRATVEHMAATLVHRGPDDDGTWADPAAGIAFGFRRLSIQDLSLAGHQPMRSASGRYVLVFNGEIYDQRRHRRALESAGVRFRGSSDTEVLIEAIAAWGIEATLREVTGMFAFALWDRVERRLVLARDRFGEKPMYWGWAGRTLVFGSELRAIRAHPHFVAGIDRGALATYVQLGYVSGPRSIYEGVERLPPASYLTIDAEGMRLRMSTYWRPASVAARARSSFTGDLEDAIRAVDETLAEVVPSRLESDVPLGAFLSGGIDSSVVVAYAQAASSTPLRTFTMGFDDERFDETEEARAVAKHLGADHTVVTVTGDDALSVVDLLPTIYDEPFADPSQIPTYLMCRLARREVTVALSGDGGDELFLGYDRYRWARDAWRVHRMLPAGVRAASVRGLDAIKAGTKVGDARLRGRPLAQTSDRLSRVLRSRGAGDFYRALGSHWSDPAALVGVAPNGDWGEAADGWSFPEAAAVVDTVAYLPDDILVKVDRAAMACSLETRAPLLDERLFELAWSLPVELRLDGQTGKRVLRETLYRKMPRSLVDRPKRGFGVPLATWLRGPLASWGADLLSEDRLRRDGLFDPMLVRRAWDEHQAGVANHEYRLWDVLMFQAWYVC